MRPLSDIPLTALRAAGLAAVMAQVKADFHQRQRRRGGTLTARERAGWLHASCGVALRRIGVGVTTEGEPPRHGLVVSNHLSYLDVLVYASLFPCLFVAKQEVAGWLLFGQFATMAGTIYVNRERTAANRSATAAMEQALRDGLPVVLFPEGTSSDGSGVLPFRSPFFEPAMQAEALVSPAAIGYNSETAAESKLAYYGGDAFAPHLLRTLGQRRVSAHVVFGAARGYADRKRAASGTQAQVEAMRTRLLAGRHSPDGPVAQQATATMAG